MVAQVNDLFFSLPSLLFTSYVQAGEQTSRASIPLYRICAKYVHSNALSVSHARATRSNSKPASCCPKQQCPCTVAGLSGAASSPCPPRSPPPHRQLAELAQPPLRPRLLRAATWRVAAARSPCRARPAAPQLPAARWRPGRWLPGRTLPARARCSQRACLSAARNNCAHRLWCLWPAGAGLAAAARGAPVRMWLLVRLRAACWGAVACRAAHSPTPASAPGPRGASSARWP